MDNKPEMSIIGHLDELRKRLIIIVAVNIGAAMLLFSKTELIMKYLIKVNPGMELVYTSPSELLLVYIQLSFLMAFIVCSPVTVYEVWAFVEKGLYSKEKKYILFTLVSGVFFFIAGVVFCYFFVLPTTLEFFIRIAIDEVSSMLSIQSYVSFVNMMLFAFGIVFEMPVLVFILTKIGILKPSFLKKNRGIIVVVVFVFAALITPPDIVSQLMLGIPMLVLFEFSIFVSSIVYRRKTREEI